VLKIMKRRVRPSARSESLPQSAAQCNQPPRQFQRSPAARVCFTRRGTALAVSGAESVLCPAHMLGVVVTIDGTVAVAAVAFAVAIF